MQRIKSLFFAVCMLSLLAGCDMNQPPPDNELVQWALRQANGALEDIDEKYGDDIMQAIDGLREADHPGGPFENDLDSARAYLLGQMREKYGIEFAIAGREDLDNYGPFAGATYTCQVAPVDAPEQVATALVSQTLYQKVRDDFAVYYFKEAAEAPVLALCEAKDYVLDQRVSLEMPGTARTWTADDNLEEFLAQSGAYVKVTLRLEDDLDTKVYAGQILDFLNSIDQLNCNLSLQARANKTCIFFSEVKVLEDFDAGSYTLEGIEDMLELQLKTGDPQ